MTHTTAVLGATLADADAAAELIAGDTVALSPMSDLMRGQRADAFVATPALLEQLVHGSDARRVSARFLVLVALRNRTKMLAFRAREGASVDPA